MWVLISTTRDVTAWGPMPSDAAYKFAELAAKGNPESVCYVVQEVKRFNGDLS